MLSTVWRMLRSDFGVATRQTITVLRAVVLYEERNNKERSSFKQGRGSQNVGEMLEQSPTVEDTGLD
jgi:hypothetical protein